jgi:hypothetical protein
MEIMRIGVLLPILMDYIKSKGEINALEISPRMLKIAQLTELIYCFLGLEIYNDILGSLCIGNNYETFKVIKPEKASLKSQYVYI